MQKVRVAKRKTDAQPNGPRSFREGIVYIETVSGK